MFIHAFPYVNTNKELIMGKKVTFNGIEILTEEGDSSARSLLGLVENVIDQLEANLDKVDENFHLFINMDFSPNTPPKHRFSVTGLTNNGTREKLTRILKGTTKYSNFDISGTVRVDLLVEDR
jgi:hypothetical protein